MTGDIAVYMCTTTTQRCDSLACAETWLAVPSIHCCGIGTTPYTVHAICGCDGGFSVCMYIN